MPRKVRQIIFDGALAYVPLTRGKTAIIEARDAHIVQGKNWTASPKGSTFYAARGVSRNYVQSSISMHRAIMGSPKDMHVDHINGNGLDNRRSNLRLATRAENMRNVKLRSDNSSGHKGVRPYKNTGKWQARITVDKKQIHLGYFATIEEAISAYNAASLKLHGRFARKTRP